MTCSEQNFVTSQCIYGIMIAYPQMDEDMQIEKALRMASKIIQQNTPNYVTQRTDSTSDSPEFELFRQNVAGGVGRIV